MAGGALSTISGRLGMAEFVALTAFAHRGRIAQQDGAYSNERQNASLSHPDQIRSQKSLKVSRFDNSSASSAHDGVPQAEALCPSVGAAGSWLTVRRASPRPHDALVCILGPLVGLGCPGLMPRPGRWCVWCAAWRAFKQAACPDYHGRVGCTQVHDSTRRRLDGVVAPVLAAKEKPFGSIQVCLHDGIW